MADRGIPQLKSHLTLRIVVTDELNNAAIFHKKQICLSNFVQCDLDYQTILVKKLEEQNNNHIGSFNYAKMIDPRKKDREICYYLLGSDKEFFSLNKTNAVLSSKIKFDREKRNLYEIILQASEHCECDTTRKECDFARMDLYDYSNILSRIKIRVLIGDINDNRPFFSQNSYVVGLTPDVTYGDLILEGEVVIFFYSDLFCPSVCCCRSNQTMHRNILIINSFWYHHGWICILMVGFS